MNWNKKTFPNKIKEKTSNFDKMEGLDWMRLHNLWCKENMSLMNVDESESDDQKSESESDDQNSNKICKLMNYCESHNVWVNLVSEEQCQKAKNVNDKCRINVYLFCTITNQSIFRVFDWRHGFRPAMFG